MRFKRTVFRFIAVLMLAMMVSCASTRDGDVPSPPSWVLSNPAETKEYVYSVGGPCRTLSQASLEATTKISAMVNSMAAALSTSSTTVISSESNNDGSREKEMIFKTEMATKSQSVINSAREISRWQDPATLMWWSLYQADKSYLF